MRHFTHSIYIALMALILIGGSQYIYAWTAPTSSAPSGNSEAPLHIGSLAQSKSGGIGLGGLLNSGSTAFLGGVKITSGQPGLGKVLVSDASGNASWKAFNKVVVDTQIQIIADTCPTGSSKITVEGRTFCGYERTTGGVGYCDTFGQEYDTQVACYNIGHGRNHGINGYPQGCQAWEGDQNYGGPGALFYCEKKKYTPKTASDCTASGAVVGTLNDTSISSSPITTCGIYTPYTYYTCSPRYMNGYGVYVTGSLSGDSCGVGYGGGWWGGTFAPYVYGQNSIHHWYSATLNNATSTTCPSGWLAYSGTCI